MQFQSNAAQAIVVYDLSQIEGRYIWSESKNEYVNKGEIITVDFNDFVVESCFTRDVIAGKFSPVDEEAKQWCKPLLELMWDAVA
jgi:hypothetical protein